MICIVSVSICKMNNLIKLNNNKSLSAFERCTLSLSFSYKRRHCVWWKILVRKKKDSREEICQIFNAFINFLNFTKIPHPAISFLSRHNVLICSRSIFLACIQFHRKRRKKRIVWSEIIKMNYENFNIIK